MLLTTDLNGTLGLWYSNKEIERFMQENLTEEQKEMIRHPKPIYLTLFEKPLAVLKLYFYIGCRDGVRFHKKSAGANNERNTRRKIKNGLCRSDHICEISTFSGKGRNGALKAHAKFGRATFRFDAHRYCNRLHRPLRAAETGCQAGRWHNLPGRRSFRKTGRAVNGDV